MGSILGIGIDVVEIDRIAQALERPHFLERCFTEGERRFGVGPEGARRLAARFSAKEAAFKALDLKGGLRRFQDVEVVRGDGGPSLHLKGRARERLEAMKGDSVRLSFSHGRDVAVAVVVVEG